MQIQGDNPNNLSSGDFEIKEVDTIGTVAADTKMADKWTKTSGVQAWREAWGSNTKGGSYYALKVTGDGSAGTVQWSDGNQASNPQFYYNFADKNVVLGAWVKSSSADKTRIGITDSTGTAYSSYHTGGGTYEWLEVTKAIASDTTNFSIVLDAGTSTTAYFSQPMLNFGTYLGQGNYVKIPGEVIWFEAGINSAHFYAAGFSDYSAYVLNIEIDSNLKIPHNARSLIMRFQANDSGSAGTQVFVTMGSAATAYAMYFGGTVNDFAVEHYVQTACANGQMVSNANASGTATLDIYIQYHGVQL
jgi:hypothetical protein